MIDVANASSTATTTAHTIENAVHTTTQVINQVKQAPITFNQILQDSVNLLGEAKTAVAQAAMWGKMQAVDVIHQFIMWNLSIDIFGIIVPILIATVLTIVFRKSSFYKGSVEAIKAHEKALDDDGTRKNRLTNSELEGHVAIVFFTNLFTVFIPWIIGPIIALINLYDLIEILVAPKLYLIEYAANLVKNHH